jgi:hypothetical protein
VQSGTLLKKIHLIDKGYGEASFMVESGLGTNSINAYTVKTVMEMMRTDFIPNRF